MAKNQQDGITTLLGIKGVCPVYKHCLIVLENIYLVGKFWSDGYFVRSVSYKVTADMIRKYIEYQTQKETPSN